MPTEHPYSTGFCAVHNPESSHRRCAERFAPGYCACRCHAGEKPWEIDKPLVLLPQHQPKTRRKAS